jgi:uncharacterized protein (TIGR03437 family)
LAATILLLSQARAQSTDTPSGFEQIESAFLAFMQAHNLPGASLAIARNGRLVLARGYGLADVDQGQAVQPDSVFRFGSIGKTITAIAVMKLVEAGKLDLDAPAFALLPDIHPRSGRIGDSRINQITVRNLLTHSGGWDSTVSGEPIVTPLIAQIASAMKVPFPPPPEAIISYMLDRKLDFDPGARLAYSNFGFVVLGRIVERVSGQPYNEFARQQILAPLGIERMRLARTILPLRAPGEVRYYDYPGAPLVDSFMPGVSGKVSEPYSGMLPFESIDSAGAWIASSIDLVRIFTMLDGKRPPAVLSPASVQRMVTPVFRVPTLGIDAANGKPVFYGLGIAVDGSGPDAEWWHNGGTWGTHAFVARLRNGWTWAAIFNSAPRDLLYTTQGGPDFDAVLQSIFGVDALEAVSWPDIDLFPPYLPSGRPSIAPAGVVNSANGQTAAIAPGELITIYGTYLGPPDGASPAASADGVLPVEYSGTSVSVDGIAAPLLFVSGAQVNAVVPFGIVSSTLADLRIRAFGYESEPLSAPTALAAPALFTADGSGNGQAAALNQDGTINSAANPASAGSIVTVYGTGFGATAPIGKDGMVTASDLANIALPVSVIVAGKDALVTYAGNAPGLVAGVAQIDFQIPIDVQPGEAAIAISAGAFTAATVATIAVK